MEKYIVTGGKKLQGVTRVSGSKNVALKALVAACLTDEKVIIKNIPLISDLAVMAGIIKDLGGEVTRDGHTLTVHAAKITNNKISLDAASHTRTSSMFIAPMLHRAHAAVIPNPGGCRLGARPIDRTIEGLIAMGAEISYDSRDGYFYAKASNLHGVVYQFEKNTHTGTETMIIASVLAKGKTILKNAAEEPEVLELINLLQSMGAHIKKTSPRVIEIEGVEKLHKATFTIAADRNEIVTFAIAALLTEGDITIENVKGSQIAEFVEKVEEIGGGVEALSVGMRFYYKGSLTATKVTTAPYPGFMTDWQAPWAVLMTKANGVSTIHETIFENRFGYVLELKKMGAKIEFFNPSVDNPQEFYNFNLEDDNEAFFHAIKIFGPTKLHNAVVTITDLRAGATLVLAALAANGESVVHGVEHVKRGYEDFDSRLRNLGANIKSVED